MTSLKHRAALLLVGLVVACGSTTADPSADGGRGGKDDSSALLIHFKKPVDWTNAGSPRVHHWGAQPAVVADTTWPGVEMVAEGNGWYVVSLPGVRSTSLVFNNNPAPQTMDLARTGEGWYADGTWTDRRPDGSPEPDNLTILQAFDWYIQDPTDEDAPYTRQPEPESNLWEYLAVAKAAEIAGDHFTHVWLPPTGKAFTPDASYNVGYAVYDHYDLGEFDQMRRVRTKYGTRPQLEAAVAALQARGIKVIADIVMNHMLGTARSAELPVAVAYDTTRGERSTGGTVTAFVEFDFMNATDPGPRGATHSSFRWSRDDFTGMENYGVYYLFAGKSLGVVNNFKDLTWADDRWSSEYQYLRSDIILGADLDLARPRVADEMVRWTTWLVDTVGFDGFRVDAVRHMHGPFIARWARDVRSHMVRIGKGGADMMMFGENWDGWAPRLAAYLDGSTTGTNHEYDLSPISYSGIERAMSLLDVPLHYAFQKVSGENVEWLDISRLPEEGLVALRPEHAITFVDNHDTIPTQPLASYINVANKLQAYAFILLNEKGTPCVFYRDLYKGNYVDPYHNDHAAYLHDGIERLLEARAKYAYGAGTYHRAPGLLGYRRSGDGHGHAGGRQSGLVYLIRQFDPQGNPTGSASSLDIPTDGRSWTLFLGAGTRSGSTFTLAPGARLAVWVPQP
jgi:alpha-amylase